MALDGKIHLTFFVVALSLLAIPQANASVFDEVNPYISALNGTPAAGPYVGFFEALESAYNAKALASSQYSLESALHEIDNRQAETLRQAGVDNPPQISPHAIGGVLKVGYKNYLDMVKLYYGGEAETQSLDELTQELRNYDTKIEDLKKSYPSLHLLTSQEIMAQVRENAQKAEYHEQRIRHTFAGSLGGFLGGLVALVNPALNPLYTLIFVVSGWLLFKAFKKLKAKAPPLEEALIKVGITTSIFGGLCLLSIFLIVMVNGSWPDFLEPVQRRFQIGSEFLGLFWPLVLIAIFVGRGIGLQWLGDWVEEKALKKKH